MLYIEIIKNTAAVVGCISACTGLLVSIVRPIRRALIRWIQAKSNTGGTDARIAGLEGAMNRLADAMEEMQSHDRMQREALLCILRSTITLMYYKYTRRNSLPNYERENLVKIYGCYHAMHGNSYVDLIYEELLALPTVG